MAYDRSSPRNQRRRQSIPLQDLNVPPNPTQSDDARGHSRSLSGRARSLLGHGQSLSGRSPTAYQRVDEDSPPPSNRAHLTPPHITTPKSAYQTPYHYEDGEISPLNTGEFQTAVGSVGLSFDTSSPSDSSRARRGSSPGGNLAIITETDGIPPFAQTVEHFPNENGNEPLFSLTDDNTPLTDERFLQPISGSQASIPLGQRHDRQNSQFSFQEQSSPGSMLGDDLPLAEAGMGRPTSRQLSQSMNSTNRSLSVSAATSPLSRAGSMMRKMSQRVVNLSNEPEIIEQSIRRQPSIKHARLEEPPSFPAMPEYAHDEHQRLPQAEKFSHLGPEGGKHRQTPKPPNPLKGKSLYIFGPDNWVRLQLCELLVHPFTEPIILVLIIIQTVLLAVYSAPSLAYDERPKAWQSAWINYAMMVLFLIYTSEIIARTIVSGFIKNPDEYSSVDWKTGFRKGILEKWRTLWTPNRPKPARGTTSASIPGVPQPSIIQSFSGIQDPDNVPGNSRQQQRVRLARRAFLRHSFNRLDFLAVTSFWISFLLAKSSVQERRHVYVFQMLSCLRILRLLALTSGTSVILRSLKKAAPLLVNVAFLIGFFWLLFAIIGVQSFKSSFRRTCIWYEDIENFRTTENTYTQNIAPKNIQLCGGHLDALTGEPMPWLKADFSVARRSHKGYLCPQRSLCVEGVSAYNGTVSFDNVLQSLQLVFVIISSNSFSELLYYTMDSDFLAAALFFAFGFVILSLWLINLLVAVITSSFQVIREESKASAFTAEPPSPVMEEEPLSEKSSSLKRAYDKTHWLWISIIVFGLVVQTLRSADMSTHREAFINNTETVVTLLFLLEICFRFIVDWRNFHRRKDNWVDFGLAIITSIIQLPPIHRSGMPYYWLTFFQIVRIYRVVLAIPITRGLIAVVLKNVTGLLNLIIFVFLITFLVAIFAVQIYRGELPSADFSGNTIRITFSDIYNSFLGMYQVLSSENWTILMYNATQYEIRWSTAWIGAIFFILWFILANLIILNMFIAVIQENFDVTEDEKRLHQVKAFLHQKELGGSSHGNLSLSTIFRLGRTSGRHQDPLDYGRATAEMLLKETVVRDFLDEQMDPLGEVPADAASTTDGIKNQRQSGFLSAAWSKLVGTIMDREPNPFYSRLQFSRAYDKLDPQTMAKEVATATKQRKQAQHQYLKDHPRYNVSMFIFKPENKTRRFCQRIVGPGRGKRIEGVNPVKPIWFAFSAFIYATIVTMVLLACISTPLYQREYFRIHGDNRNRSLIDTAKTWFVWTDMGFSIVFTIEAVIKVIADGFFWTPNAYFRGSWGFIDGLVLVTLWINVITSLYKDKPISRAVGAFKALRALRLLNVSDSARETFHSVIILGGWKVLSSAFVSLSLLIPFAIYGLNLFNGQMLQCNDNDFSPMQNLSNCVGEYKSSPYKWDVLAPRRVANPYYNFDNFGNSLFILFQIVSQEGWTDVMWSAMSAAGRGLQPQDFRSQGNALFFIVFNLLGAVFVLTLFVSVFMRNYTEQTGVAFLTTDQRSWLELRKLLRQISPSKRPSSNFQTPLRAWCYRIAITKAGRWQRFLTLVLLIHLVLLVMEFYPENTVWTYIRDYIFLSFTLFYVANIIVRILGLTWKRFRKSSWDLYSIFSVAGTFITTLLALSRRTNQLYGQLHKFFLVSIALLLIPRNNQLDQLFKTAAASLTAIANLLATWFVLFLVYAIALTQTFGLTRFGSNESGNLNFRNVPKALILLFRMSCGESWNNIMEDFATIQHPNCVRGESYLDGDCGSATWARVLFISWNILSMYIFVSLFVSLIFESFSYVYQRSSGPSVVDRKEIRRFKEAWATFDPDGTGYISKEAFPRLLGELSGVFEMRIYDGEHSVSRIIEDCFVHTRGTDQTPDLPMLNARLSTIDVSEIRRRRRRLDLFFQEVMVSASADRGVNFTSCLMILAHYNVISDNKSLRLEEYLRRRARLQRVEEEVSRLIVKGFFDMMYSARRFRSRIASRSSARMMTVPQFAVPEIFVEDQDADIPQGAPLASPASGISPTEMPTDRLSLDAPGSQRQRDSRAGSPSRIDRGDSVSPHASPHRPSPSDGSGSFIIGYDGTDSPIQGNRSRAGSSVDQQQALKDFNDSAWGESIRRSFTLRRSGTRIRRRSGYEGR